jgi:hypothetical protein
MLHLKLLEKQEQAKSKLVDEKIINIKMDTNEMENKKGDRKKQ